MNIFKSTTFTWWQVGALKWSVFCIGIAVGVYWHEYLAQYLISLAGIGAVLAVYITYIWVKQR